MSLLAGPPDPGTPERARLELARTVDRLRSMPLARLTAAVPDDPAGTTRAALVVAAAQQLADSAASRGGTPHRVLPRLPPHAAPDVLAVCGSDLLEALSADPDPACTRALTEQLIELRRRM